MKMTKWQISEHSLSKSRLEHREGQVKMAKWHNNSVTELRVGSGLHPTWSKIFNMYAHYAAYYAV